MYSDLRISNGYSKERQKGKSGKSRGREIQKLRKSLTNLEVLFFCSEIRDTAVSFAIKTLLFNSSSVGLLVTATSEPHSNHFSSTSIATAL
jgi:hypothetical protein